MKETAGCIGLTEFLKQDINKPNTKICNNFGHYEIEEAIEYLKKVSQKSKRSTKPKKINLMRNKMAKGLNKNFDMFLPIGDMFVRGRNRVKSDSHLSNKK